MKTVSCLLLLVLVTSDAAAQRVPSRAPATKGDVADLLGEMRAMNASLTQMEGRLNDKIDGVRKDVSDLDKKVDDRMTKLETRVARLEDRPATALAATVATPTVVTAATQIVHVVHNICPHLVWEPCGCGCGGGRYVWSSGGPTWGYGGYSTYGSYSYGGYSGWYGGNRYR